MKKIISLLILLVVFNCVVAYATEPIDSNRKIDWSSAGVVGGVPTLVCADTPIDGGADCCRTTACDTLYNDGASPTLAHVNAAIASVNYPTTGRVVRIRAATATFNGMITMKTNAVLRGAGADQTKLTFSGGGSCASWNQSSVCMSGSSSTYGYQGTAVNWTDGYTKGTTTITLASIPTGVSSSDNGGNGSILLLDQLQDTSDPGAGQIFDCDGLGVCSYDGASGGQRTNRAQGQLVRVTNVSETNVTISPGLYMPNWTNTRTPQAVFVGANAQIYSSGIENLSLNHNYVNTAGIQMLNSYQCWVRGIRSISPANFHIVLGIGAKSDIIRDSYFFTNTSNTSSQYGINVYVASDCLIENNIFHQVDAPLAINGQASGFVWAYNYSIYDKWGFEPAMNGSVWLHGGSDLILSEGNIGNAFFSDAMHGVHSFVTLFRNYYNGWEAQSTEQTVPVMLDFGSRYFNLIGNILGRTSYHNAYQSTSNTNTAIVFVGDISGSFGTDSLVASTLMKWGNYDTYNNAVRWQNSEVPSGIAGFPNAVPADHGLPNSYYLSAKPVWWGSIPWPPIGPDVTGGGVYGSNGTTTWVLQTNVGAYVNQIPALNCYKNTMGGPADGTGSVLSFNAATCYPTSGTTPPSATGCTISGGTFK